MKNYKWISLIFLFFSQTSFAADTLVLYSSRIEDLLKPLIQKYESETGTKIQVVNGKDGWLIERIKREGDKSSADILLTVDAGNLWFAAQEGVLASFKESPAIEAIPDEFKDSKNRWVGLSLRARPIFYNKNKVKPSELKSYEDLADKKWKDRLCLRTSQKVYNQSLTAMLIHHHGVEEATRVVKGWVDNLGRPVFTSDELLLRAIDQGSCDVGIANTYYLARLKEKGEAPNVEVFWPNQGGTGVHVNVSGAGIVKSSKNKEAAQKFVEWLATKGQKTFAESNHEYPVIEDVAPSNIIQKWGKFEKDKAPLEKAGELQRQAVQLMDKVGYR